jgi:hypothetical protein
MHLAARRRAPLHPCAPLSLSLSFARSRCAAGKPRAQLSQLACYDMSDACSKKAPPVPKVGRPAGTETRAPRRRRARHGGGGGGRAAPRPREAPSRAAAAGAWPGPRAPDCRGSCSPCIAPLHVVLTKTHANVHARAHERAHAHKQIHSHTNARTHAPRRTAPGAPSSRRWRPARPSARSS